MLKVPKVNTTCTSDGEVGPQPGDLLEGAPGLPLPIKTSLLADVMRGLLYLHTRHPPVFHRDFDANILLLTSSDWWLSHASPEHLSICLPKQLMTAHRTVPDGHPFICSLHRQYLITDTVRLVALTHIPRTFVYMPPEAIDDGSLYGPRWTSLHSNILLSSSLF